MADNAVASSPAGAGHSVVRQRVLGRRRGRLVHPVAVTQPPQLVYTIATSQQALDRGATALVHRPRNRADCTPATSPVATLGGGGRTVGAVSGAMDQRR